ncbi:DUF72 domain-containing protein [Noviherbaspirillum sp. CPCC 100848]|uniref:DUF72 domain-containing protein n=1 Tax=Noviherbaspirillum album TaxID=3080276 RepID=A0ABU6J777_9BURK|nr:DUF72 domain-containing protein [Noviherbaspirillum sp. CPCC 100848]MEC4719054.1 DUF72 domain-containing protein [Noviherbaspirillum sp. CPCC 100848]
MQNQSKSSFMIGCAGWSLSSAVAGHFPEEGSHLERYARVLPAVEINTSFYRPHRPITYARWRDSVPEDFRFSAKVPKAITHEARLQDAGELLERFIGEVRHLEHKLGCLLVQLPPSLRFDAPVARQFFQQLNRLTDVDVVCEPRHATWFTPAAADMLHGRNVAYVQADPEVMPLENIAAGAGVVYLRLHGSPEMYHSSYPESYLDALAARMQNEAAKGRKVWCVFDNTASGAAVPNALSLLERLDQLDQTAAAEYSR